MKYFLFLLFLPVLCLIYSLADECGSYRWAIKTLTDKKGDSILQLVPDTSSLKKLLSEKRKIADYTSDDSTRYTDECRLVLLDVTLWKIKQGDDHDFHLVLKSPNGLLMVAEIPDGNCGAYNNFPDLRKRFNDMRKNLIDTIGFVPEADFKNVDRKVWIEGIPFWDKIKKGHSPKYGAANKHEIHPVTKIIFK